MKTVNCYQLIRVGSFRKPEWRLVGNVYGIIDGEYKTITTSAIVKIEGDIVTTRSGSQYKLGKIAPGERDRLKGYNPGWDKNNPYKGRVF